MKKIFYISMFLLLSGFVATQASAQVVYERKLNKEKRESFVFYPKSNVYYSFGLRQYLYPAHGSWITSYRAPHFLKASRENGFIVYHNGLDVWADNRMHIADNRYKGYDAYVAYSKDHRYYNNR